MPQNQEYIKEFAEEALNHIEIIENILLDMEKGEADQDIINELLRSTHSIKGTAGFFQLKNIVKLSHAMESFLGELREGAISINSEIIDILLDANDCLRYMVEHVENSENVDVSVHIANLAAHSKKGVLKDMASLNPGQGLIMEQTEANTCENQQIETKFKIDSREKAILEDALRHGHKLYRAYVCVNEGADLGKINIIGLFKKAQSIGNIFESHSGFTKQCFTFLFTSVLEKNLAALALEIPEDDIMELSGMEELANINNQKRSTENGNEDIAADTPHAQTEIIKRSEFKKEENSIIEDSIRVHTALLDDLLNLAGEMIMLRNRLLQVLKGDKNDVQGLESILKSAGYITKELQEKIMQTRMQPVANVLNKFPRMVRELSRKLGKEIELQMEGLDVDLDKSIIESLADPLTHIIRNAVDHGIEKPEVRINEGKPRTGTITIKACHEGGYVKIDITDDGAGINIENIRKKAVEKGILKDPENLNVKDSELLKLLFLPGFSTAEEVTDISGRGVGMDVVKANIEKLGGSVEVDTVIGKGTAFRLILPLTVAIIPSIIVGVLGEKYAVPQMNLQEIIRIKPGDVGKRIEHINNKKVLRLRDEFLPLLNLSHILGLERQGNYKNVDILRVLIIKVRTGRFGLIVDAVLDSEEIIIKPLPVYLKDCKFYSGITILGDGRTAMIIDPEGIASELDLKTEQESDPV